MNKHCAAKTDENGITLIVFYESESTSGQYFFPVKHDIIYMSKKLKFLSINRTKANFFYREEDLISFLFKEGLSE